MKIYRLTREDGKTYAFEVENAYIRPRAIANLLKAIDDVSSVHLRKAFSPPPDVHLEFTFNEAKYIVWEPFGDSSRYWIGPQHESRADIGKIADWFEKYNPPRTRNIIGDILTLNIKKTIKTVFEKH